MNREEEIFKRMLQSIDEEIEPPEGIKQKILEEILYQSEVKYSYYCFYHDWFLTKILKLALPLSILMTIFTKIQTGTN